MPRPPTRHARAHPTTHHSNFGELQSSWDFVGWGGMAGAELLDRAMAMAKRLTAGRGGGAVSVTWRIDACANINGKGHGNEFHAHPSCF